MSICIECGTRGDYGGCCRVPLEELPTQLPITQMDIERIKKIADLDEDEFVEHSIVHPDFLRAITNFSELLGRMMPSGYRRALKLNPQGQCVFLKHGVGCSLGKHRPVICKIFPFWPDTKELIPKPGGCLAADRSAGDRSTLKKLMDTSDQELENLGEVLRGDVEHLERVEGSRRRR